VPTRSPESIAIDLPHGRALVAAIQPEATAQSVEVTLIEEIRPRIFDTCPICFAPATDDEHVPPASLHGEIMTRTCQPCNNRLGSRIEADLSDWFDNALTLPRFTSGTVRGKRRSGRILWRTTPDGEVVLLMDGKFDPAILEMLASGQVDLAGMLPDHNRYRLALLKHAYLAACLRFGVLVGEAADEIRRDLVAARDAASRLDVPVSPIALGLTVIRFTEPRPDITAPLIRAVADEPAGPCEGVILAGRIFVSWSSLAGSENQAIAPRHLTATLTVGGRIEGIVAAADAD
jgi:hypothetical protein